MSQPKARRVRTAASPPPQGVLAEGDLWIFELAPRLTRLRNAALTQVTPSLTFRQYRHLRRVAEGFNTLTAIGERGTLSLPTISESLETLVRKSLLRRVTQSHDRRSKRLELTPDGERVLQESQAVLDDLANQLLEGLSQRRRAEFRRNGRTVGQRVSELLRERATDGPRQTQL